MRLLSNHSDNIYYIIEGNIDDCNTLNRKAIIRKYNKYEFSR